MSPTLEPPFWTLLEGVGDTANLRCGTNAPIPSRPVPVTSIPNLTPVWAPPSRPAIYFRATFSSTCSPASNPSRPFPQIHGLKRSLAANLTTFMSWVPPLPNCAHRPLKIHPSNLSITHPSPSQTTT